ncbi:uL22 family ribosomal protein [Candidatus Gottesmanbacteria bacterium]|nr:uL22 family ribosomal protein [Candidatus Gottesmanbacteria bacterium]
MEVTAVSKYLHVSPKKMKEFGHISIGLSPMTAIERLQAMEGKMGKLLAKSVKSAYDNAVNTHKLEPSRLQIKSIQILKGPHLKRWRAVSRGMAHQIKRRTTHVRIILSVRQDDKSHKKEKEIKE